MARKPPDRLKSLLTGAKNRAKRCKGKRKCFDLSDHTDALRVRFDTGRCELTGLPFNMTASPLRAWNSPSIDRIDPKLGYTIDNVRFIVWALNSALQDWGEEVLELVTAAWLYQRAVGRCKTC